MAKILITGMTAAQTSSTLHARNKTFAGLLADLLQLAGHEVTWTPADIEWTEAYLSTYDRVLVGIAAPTSLSSNYVYGALNVLSWLADDPKLTLFIDAPKPQQIEPSLRLVTSPEQLVKPFYSQRKHYLAARQPDTLKRLHGVIQGLIDGHSWVRTLYPMLPWQLEADIQPLMPVGSRDKLVGVNLDTMLLNTPESGYTNLYENTYINPREKMWAIDLPKTRWSLEVLETVSAPGSPMRWHKGWDDAQVRLHLSRCLGAIVAPQGSGTWWTNSYANAMRVGTPVYTMWQESIRLGDAWNVLAATIEHLDGPGRDALAAEQLEQYLDAIQPIDAIQKTITETLHLNSRKH